MTTQIHIGDTAKTLGPLKPTGRISVNGHTIDASSEGQWVDSDADVVIVGGNTRRAVVRESSRTASRLRNHGKRLPEEKEFEETPLQSPPAWVERVNSVAIGLIIGIVLVPIFWLSGVPFSVYALLVPVSSASAGWLFRVFVGTAIQSVGPREDHRPRARAIALLILLCCFIGSAIGLNMGLGFLGLCCGIPLGALGGGMLTYVGLVVSPYL